MWGGINASPFPCNEVYRGPGPGSEYETIAISNFLVENRDVLVTYMSFHSYTQNWLTRWSYDSGEQPREAEWLRDISKRAVDAIEAVHGKDYQAGTAGELLYNFTGGSADFAHGVANIRYSFLIELRDTGVYGFLLPLEEVIPTAQEAWAGLKVVVRETINHIQEEEARDTEPDIDRVVEEITNENDEHLAIDPVPRPGPEFDYYSSHNEDEYYDYSDYLHSPDRYRDDFTGDDSSSMTNSADSISSGGNAFNSDNTNVEVGSRVVVTDQSPPISACPLLQVVTSIFCVIYIWSR